MPRAGIDPLAGAEASVVVSEGDLASALAIEPGDSYPAVFATTRMIGLMEVAASRCLKPLLEAGELSVGVVVDVKHTAPTPPGATVTARARFLGMNGKLFRFEVEAHDGGGEIGRGFHERAIIATARLLEGAKRRG